MKYYHWDTWKCSWPLDSKLTFRSGSNPVWNGYFSPSTQWDPFLTQKEVSRTRCSELLHSKINIVFLLYQHINELNQSEVNWCLTHWERALKPSVLCWKLHLNIDENTKLQHALGWKQDRRRRTREMLFLMSRVDASEQSSLDCNLSAGSRCSLSVWSGCERTPALFSKALSKSPLIHHCTEEQHAARAPLRRSSTRPRHWQTRCVRVRNLGHKI